MASIPTQRTIAELKKRGYTCHIVERYNSFIKRRQDFGGWADILAYKAGEPGVLGIQTTSDSNVSSHVHKLTKYDPLEKGSATRLANIRAWIGASNRIEIWGWGKKGARGERKLWTLRTILVELPKAVAVLNGTNPGPVVEDEMPEEVPF